MDLKKEEWNFSYLNKDNFVFYPHEEIIRFTARYIAKRVGLDKVNYLVDKQSKILDLGCGIGRHLIFFNDLGMDIYGVDLSEEAINVGEKWLDKENIEYKNKLFVGSANSLPWNEGTFDFIVSHAVLDSMTFDIAKSVVSECHRVITKDGLFYCDLIGENNLHGPGFEKEIIVDTAHEKGTIQSYFTENKIQNLFEGFFEIIEIKHIINKDCISKEYNSRYHLILKKIERFL